MTRVIINGISFFTTWKRLKEGTVSDSTSINAALEVCMSRMQRGYTGLSTTVTIYDDRMKRTVYNIQITKG